MTVYRVGDTQAIPWEKWMNFKGSERLSSLRSTPTLCEISIGYAYNP